MYDSSLICSKTEYSQLGMAKDTVSFSSENDGFHPGGCSPYMNVSKGAALRGQELSLKLLLQKANP